MKFIERIKSFSPFHRKMNNPSVPTGLPLYPTGDKPIVFANEAILFWLECAPVATAVDKISLEVSSIQPKVFDTKNEEFIDNHPLIDLLNKPDADITYKEFIQSIVTFYLVTGNVYLRALGFKNNPPKTIRVAPSQGATIVVDYDGYPRNITTRILALIDTFNRFEVKEYGQVRFRYYADDFKELYHIRTFNPYIGSNMVYGVSPLNHVFYEMRQYVDSAKHNLSTLQRATRLGGLFRVKDRLLPKDQRQRMEEQINYAAGGANNAGRTLVLDDQVEYEDLLKNPRDMDYVQLKKQVTNAIYNALKIPLPLVSPDHMTLANMETAKFLLYDNAVLPIARRIFEELTNFLMPRYGDSEGRYILTFQEDNIPALQTRRNEQLKLKIQSGLFTRNELRADCGSEPLDGGNSIYGAAMQVPVAKDTSGRFPVEDLDQSDDDIHDDDSSTAEEDEAAIAASKEKFINVLSKQVEKDGSRRFTDDEIKEMVSTHYGD